METDAFAAAAAILKEMEEARRYEWSSTIGEEMQRRIDRTMQANAHLADVDPWHLPPRFIMRKDLGNLSLQTPSGYWKEKEDELRAIRGASLSYQGIRRTLEFYEHSGTKTDWVIHQYQQLDPIVPSKHDGAALFLQEDVVLRKVFNKSHTDQVPADFRSLDDLFPEKQVNAVELSLCGDKITKAAKVIRDAIDTAKFAEFILRISKLYEASLGGCSGEGSGCGEFPTVSGTPDGESDVWQHFTRINTKDPNVVYAACRRCDRVLKAHPKNGTSHLRRHREAKACSCNSNPSSTTEDQEILHDLRAHLDLYKQGKEGVVDSPELIANLGKVDPWDLPPRHFTSSLSRYTHQGSWKEVNNKLTAIRSDQLLVPNYVGLKRTLEFHHNNGTKMDWIMLEYYQVDEYMPPTLFLEGNMVFRKVFQINEGAIRELSRMLDRDDEEEECYKGEHEEEVEAFVDTLIHDCLRNQGVQGDQPQSRKRKRSEVWLHFTKIYSTDPKRVYAVCHCCDRVYKAHPKKDGTSHLKRHNQTCSSKRRNLEGMKQSSRLH